MSDRLCSLGTVCTHCRCGRSWYCHILQDRHTSPPCLARDTGCHLSWPSVLHCKSPPRMPGEGWTWLRAKKKSSESLILGHVDAPSWQCSRQLRQVRVRGVHGWARHPRQPCPRSTAIWAAPAAAACHLQAAPHHSPPRPRNLPQKLPWHAAAAPASRRRDGAATGPRFQPPSPRLLAGKGIWEVVGAGCGQPLCCVYGCRACPYCLLLLLHKPTRVMDGHFSSLSQKDLASQALAREIGVGLGSAWAAKNLEVTNSCCRNAGIPWELWGASPGRCAPRAVAAPQHHRARFPKGKAMLERASVLI